jgi:hypothetical protein
MTNAVKVANLITAQSVDGQAVIANAAGNVFVTGITTMTGAINVGDSITLTQPSSGNAFIDIPMNANGNTNVRARFTGDNMKHLGFFNFRDGSQYLHVKTNISSNSCMFMFHVMGYLYNQGNVISWSGGYTYTPPSSILNQYNSNVGSGSTVATYRTAGPAGGGFLCLRVNRNTSSYSEGFLSIFFHSHDTPQQNSTAVTAFAQNNDGGNFYTS